MGGSPVSQVPQGPPACLPAPLFLFVATSNVALSCHLSHPRGPQTQAERLAARLPSGFLPQPERTSAEPGEEPRTGPRLLLGCLETCGRVGRSQVRGRGDRFQRTETPT